MAGEILVAAAALDKATSDSTVETEAYLELYRSIRLFLIQLGKVMSFVVSDIDSKMKILEDYVAESPQVNSNLQSMIQFEVDNNLTANTKKASASRTLLRLHRALEFIVALIDGLVNETENKSASAISRAAYDNTLSPHHTWIVRTGVQVSLKMIGSRETIEKSFFEYACESNPNEETGKANTKIICTQIRRAHQVVQQLYDQHQLHQLP
eukprot:m.62381 g.62381  ORF g.62381 m.62381 type:complete len:210 (-) comp23140_c3_seq1:267-896(-)